MTRDLIAAIALAILAAASVTAQDVLADWTFDDDTAQWQAIDPAAQFSVTGDPNVVREDDNAVAEYSYSAQIGTMSGIMTPVDVPLVGAETLSFWLRTTDLAIVALSIDEADGSNYMAGMLSLPDRWQEVSLGFGEFQLDDDSIDENGQLDADQIAGIGIIDVTPFIAEMAAQVTFIEAPDLGPRIMWIDDMSVDDEPMPPRWETVEVDGARAIRLDSFESTPLQWFMLAGKSVEIDYDDEITAEGNFSLRIIYDLAPGKLLGLMGSPASAPLEGTTRLRVSLLSENKTTLMIGLGEKDKSEYHVLVPLEAGQDFQALEFDFTDFELDEDGADENGKLDIDQVTEISINDVSFMTGEPVGYNTLWIDDILFIE